MADKKKPKSIEELEKNQDMIRDVLASLGESHSRAYLAASDKHLKAKGSKTPNMKLLEDEDVIDKFVDEMFNEYLKSALEYFGAKKDGYDPKKDAFKIQQMVSAYAKVSKKDIKDAIRVNGKNYSIKAHEEISGKLIKKSADELAPIATQHLKQKDKGDFIKYVGADKYVNLDAITLDDALEMYGMFKENNESLTREIVADKYRGKTGYKKPHYFKKEAA